jgi:hypothetical protein
MGAIVSRRNAVAPAPHVHNCHDPAFPAASGALSGLRVLVCGLHANLRHHSASRLLYSCCVLFCHVAALVSPNQANPGPSNHQTRTAVAHQLLQQRKELQLVQHICNVSRTSSAMLQVHTSRIADSSEGNAFKLLQSTA